MMHALLLCNMHLVGASCGVVLNFFDVLQYSWVAMCCWVCIFAALLLLALVACVLIRVGMY